jgi:hypothetical protein
VIKEVIVSEDNLAEKVIVDKGHFASKLFVGSLVGSLVGLLKDVWFLLVGSLADF